MSKKVEVIKVTNEFKDEVTNAVIKKRKVCAYARVSTDQEDQINSYNNQIEEYTKRIQENPEWEFVGMYADEGISGTSLTRRKEFNRMVKDAEEGKIDLILTKSISRFGRNVVDNVKTIRDLRNKGVVVFFEKENIYSNDTKADFVFSILSSVAQEESRGISTNIKWAINKNFREGNVKLKPIYAYSSDGNGSLVVKLDEAEIVKSIFNLALLNLSPYRIQSVINIKLEKEYNEKKEKGLIDESTKFEPFSIGRIHSILRNEKYKGDVLLQKTLVPDYLSHRSIKNDNLAPKYLIKNNHEGIVSKKDFDNVQLILSKRTNNQILNKNISAIVGLIYCFDCLRPLKKHYWMPKDGYKYVKLDCKHAQKQKIDCHQTTIEYELVDDLVSHVTHQIIENESFIESLKFILQSSLKSSVSNEIKTYEEKINEITLAIDNLITLKSDDPRGMSDSTFTSLYNEKRAKKDSLQKQLDQLKIEEIDRTITQRRIDTILKFTQSSKIDLSVLYQCLYKVIFRDDHHFIFILNDKENIDSSFKEIKENYKNLNLLFEDSFQNEDVKHPLTYEVRFK